MDGAGLVLAVVETLETEEVAAGLLAVTAVAETLLGSILTVSVLLQAVIGNTRAATNKICFMVYPWG